MFFIFLEGFLKLELFSLIRKGIFLYLMAALLADFFFPRIFSVLFL